MFNAEELTAFLSAKKVCIVHFSHHANMREGGVFPDDLRAAIANHEEWNLSCCALWPQHNMALPGDVGVLFELDQPNQVISVCSEDAGASQLQDGEDQSAGSKPDLAAVEKSLEVACGTYNEWRINGAKVAGIYVEDPDRILAKRKIKFEALDQEHETISATTVELEDVRTFFPGMKIFTFKNGCLVETY